MENLKDLKQAYDPKIIKRLISEGHARGLNDAQIAALAANSMYESGHNYLASNGSFRGLFQWHKSQADHVDFNDINSQFEYLWKELSKDRGRWPSKEKKETFNGWNPKYYKRWSTPNLTPEEYSNAFEAGYERHGSIDPRRAKAARRIYDIIIKDNDVSENTVQDLYDNIGDLPTLSPLNEYYG